MFVGRVGRLAIQMIGAAMSCGVGVEVCGVLALMTGLGSGVQNVTGGAVYGHPTPVVHGLWPQTPPFGDSACVAPSAGSANATRIYPCYQCTYPGETNCSGIPHHSPTNFQDHEWSKHGTCAGVRDAQDYLAQVCALAAPPLLVLSAARSAGTSSLSRFKGLLEAAAPEGRRFEVFGTNEATAELYLSACALPSGVWVLAPTSRFGAACGGERGTHEESQRVQGPV